jgi:hypothetical protein
MSLERSDWIVKTKIPITRNLGGNRI